jgi:predicted LPLAT superfamily acyltransferase
MSSPHWSQVQEAGALHGMRFMFAVYRWLGRAPFMLVLFPVILYFYLFRRSARDASQEFLQQLRDTGQLNSTQPLWWLSYRHLFSFGSSLLDKLAAWQGDITPDDVNFHDRQAFDKACEEKRGALIIGSHLGNLEVCRALSMQRPNLKINVLSHTGNAANFNDLIDQAGTNSRINIIEVSEINPGTAIMLNDRIAAGEFIITSGDRTPLSGDAKTTVVDFLGRPAKFPQGPFILAAILKCPVFTLFCTRAEPGSNKENAKKFDFHITPFADEIRLPRKQRDVALVEHVQKFSNCLAAHCAKTPLQWYNFFPFWND